MALVAVGCLQQTALLQCRLLLLLLRTLTSLPATGNESHAGQVFTCVAALDIAGRLDLVDADLLCWWCVMLLLPSLQGTLRIQANA